MHLPRTLLADDHRMMREALARLLEPACDIVGQAANGRELLDQAATHRPDLVVLDIGMPLLNGLEASRRLKQLAPNVRMIFLTVSEDPDLAREAFRTGASGYLLKNSAASELLQAVDEAMQGRTYVTPLVAKELLDFCLQEPSGPRELESLSPRQREVLQLIAEGFTMKKIAQMLDITPRTVAFHKYTMMKELGITTSAELVRFWEKQHIVTS